MKPEYAYLKKNLIGSPKVMVGWVYIHYSLCHWPDPDGVENSSSPVGVGVGGVHLPPP